MSMHKTIAPTKPVAPYIGGKSRLAKTLIQHIETIPHKIYAEPFIGMGGVFLRRTSQPKSEVINDYNADVANLFRILQRHYPQFIDTIKYQLTSRHEFNRLCEVRPETLTDLERAARFLYLQKTAFGGKVSGKTFGVTRSRSGNFNLSKLEPMLEDVHARLCGVTIECLDYAAFIDRYDTPDTLFYLDPPYYMCENDYGRDMFDRAKFPKMAKQLKKIKGSFILSLNDHKDVREIFKNFHILSVRTTYTLAGNGRAKDVGEVIISNRQLKKLTDNT